MKLTSRITINALIAAGLSFGISFAQETAPSDEVRKKAILSALDSIEENVIGFAINGTAKGGILSSALSSEALPDGEDVSEYSAFSDFLLNISIRPSSETKASFDLRFHRDWQSAYREGNNSPIIRWWSYDGNILDKKLKFNLGTMRIAYTPLTIYLPEPELIMEPEFFASLRKEAMEERYLDGTNRRLLQGLNAEFSTPVGVLDNIFLQGTIMRLRKTPNIADRIFYDFDHNNERYSTAARIGLETFGVSFSVSDVYTFNRIGGSIKATTDSFVNYEKNNVLSFKLDYNSKKQLSGPVGFGVGAEYALSNWSHSKYVQTMTSDPILIVDAGTGGSPIYLPTSTPPGGLNTNGKNDTLNRYPYYGLGIPKPVYVPIEYEPLKNKMALLANAFASFNDNPIEVKLSGHLLNVNKDFEAELAASPAYLPNGSIFNSDANLNSALEQFRGSSLENMYYSLYYTLPMNAMTIIMGTTGIPSTILDGGKELSENGYLYNNYKFSQYYRNAYNQQTFTRLERDSVKSRLDPAVNMALPYGYATPDRAGGDADLNFVWNKAVGISCVFGKYSSEGGGDFTRLGGGAEIDVARLAGLSKALTVSGSYEQNKQENGLYNPQTDRIMAGAKVGIWRGLSLIGGFQQLKKEFKNPIPVVNDIVVNRTNEIMGIGGPQVKISERAEFSLQGGLLSNSIESNVMKLDLDKYIMSGMVTVEF